uniref:Endonuclease/exonuclease/phosphatase domain-containing protein n=1 Tax=Cannabis sativa TaxID=3483 RepID=A0A803QHZ3_CANSA
MVDRIKHKLHFEACFSVDANGRKGGISLFWKHSDDARVLGYSDNHIDIEIHTRGQPIWHLTGFYGEPNRRLRNQPRHLIRVLSQESTLPWCITGDFNNIANQEDKRGGRPYPSSLLTGFQSALDDYNLIDLDLQKKNRIH